HVSNLYGSTVGPEVARTLDRLIGDGEAAGGKVFFCNSGAEANECAFKLARRWAGPGRYIVVSAYGSFHGRTFATLHATGQPEKHEVFQPLPEGFHHVAWDDIAALEAATSGDAVAAVLLEPVQGEGGVNPASAEYFQAVRRICDERGLLLILDEIYTGFGRTGATFACEHEDVVPDLLCVGKALAGGVPISAAIGTPRAMDAWPRSAGEALHTSTFMGNPRACAAALANLAELERLGVAERVRARGPRLGERLRALARYPRVRDVRGLGYLWAVEFAAGAFANRVVVRGLARGLILLQSGPTGTSITLAPPVTIEDEQLARALDLFEQTIAACEEEA
ncbi:MAG: acetylornithine/N-succinyldiaminopimelate aminotransferase, partial [Candidatus Eremiobacteraeota bacterium]|nr:acetylornithine/N-succinyldiaminopimelate aminotransferase [Candidatus Eremiobacteraeota bacterium]